MNPRSGTGPSAPDRRRATRCPGAALLRDTYRIDRGAHAEAHAALDTALVRPEIDAPATLYQATGQEMNASIFYVPGEVHIMLQGPLLERLSPEELLAVLGGTNCLAESAAQGRVT